MSGAINLDDSTLRGLVAGVITQAMAGEQRDKLITKAIEGMLAPQKADYGRPATSKLEDIFAQVVHQLAHQAVKAHFESNPESLAQLHKVIDAAIKKALFDDEETIVTKLASGISDKLAKVDRY